MIKRYMLALMGMAILIGIVSFPLVSADTTTTIDFEQNLAPGQIVSNLSCGTGIDCPPGSIAGNVTVRAGNQMFPDGENTAMIFDADCDSESDALPDCSGGDGDLGFPGNGNMLINSEDLNSSDPDDQDLPDSFMEFDFTGFGPGLVTVVSLDVTDVEFEEGEGGAFLHSHHGGCHGHPLTPGDEDIPIDDIHDHMIRKLAVGFTDVECFHVHLNGSGSIDNIEIIVPDVPEPGIDIEKLTNGPGQIPQDADTPIGPIIPVGSTVSFTYRVTNTGNVALSRVSVTDNQGVAVSCPQTTLAVGELMTCAGSKTATPGQYANIGEACGFGDGTRPPEEVCDTDPSHHFGSNPAIDIEKATNGVDADTPTGPVVLTGSTVNFTYRVTNTGNVTLSGVSVTDSLGINPGGTPGVAVSCTQTTLTPGQSMTCTGTTTATPGQYANNGEACGIGVGQRVCDNDPSHHFGASPAIDIEKLTNGVDADTPTGPVVLTGSTVNFTYQVTNTGNVTLSGVSVTDTLGVNPGGNPGVTVNCPTQTTLTPGQSMTCTGTTTATPGQYANNGEACGTGAGQEVCDNDPSHHFGASPAIDIEKLTNGPGQIPQDADNPTGPIIPVGSTVIFTYAVTNTGNVPLSNVMVTDTLGVNPGGSPGVTVDCPQTTLAVSQSMTCTGSTTATPGQYANLGKSCGIGAGQEVCDTDPSHHFGAEPEIHIEKLTNGQDADNAAPPPTVPEIKPGDEVTWTYRVTNTGNIPLENIIVGDDNGTPGVPGDDFVPTFVGGDDNNNGLLDLDETWEYSASSQALDLDQVPGNVNTVPGCGTPTRPAYENKGVATGYIVPPVNPQDEPDATDADLSHYCNPPVDGQIDIEKHTKIVAAPLSGDLCETLGKPKMFTWRYTGDNELKHSQKKGSVKGKGKLNGESPVQIESGDFEGTVQLGKDFKSEKGKIKIKAGNKVLKEIEIHTSCSQPLVLGDKYGGVQLVGYTSKDGKSATFDPDANIDDSDIGEDADEPKGPVGKQGDQVRWTYVVTNPGTVALNDVVVTDDNGTPNIAGDDFAPAFVEGDANGNGMLEPGETWLFRAEGTVGSGQYKNIGDVVGVDPNGSTVTDQDPSHHFGEAPPVDVCPAKGKPQRLTMRYIGGAGQDHSQDRGKVEVTGDPGTTSPVYIVVAEEDDGTGEMFFEGTVELDQEFIIDGRAGFKSQTFVLISDRKGGTVLQTIDFHTSCSQPLFPGNIFGGVQLVGG